MIALNNYLYGDNTVFRILEYYSHDLQKSAEETGCKLDEAHAQFLRHFLSLLRHNDFLNAQSQRLYSYYQHMAETYPELAFSTKGRIKSLIRSEEKYNGYIVEFIYDYYKEHHEIPNESQIIEHLKRFHDQIAYRIVISLPSCHLAEGEDREERELEYLYRIANELPTFLKTKGFTPIASTKKMQDPSDRLHIGVRDYYRDYIAHPKASGYRSLHITFYDTQARVYVELQLRTKDMDDYAEIGEANHVEYEKMQQANRTRRELVHPGESRLFDEAMERVDALLNLDLARVKVNFFTALNNVLMNDGCGLVKGRQILPCEHLSRFQNDGF